MNYEPNTTKWGKGDIVIHDADAKEPKMLMTVVGMTKEGLVKTVYTNTLMRRTVYLNPREVLHDPSRFGLNHRWGHASQKEQRIVQEEWEQARWFNNRYPVGTRVKTTSADGGFETVTKTAASARSGHAVVYLERGGNWELRFVEPIQEEEQNALP